jgi:Co/Zn/Cd efflux system component
MFNRYWAPASDAGTTFGTLKCEFFLAIQHGVCLITFGMEIFMTRDAGHKVLHAIGRVASTTHRLIPGCR